MLQEQLCPPIIDNTIIQIRKQNLMKNPFSPTLLLII